jgi:hypothetical protein
MGAGNILGSLWNTIFFLGLWIVMGAAVDKLFSAFNTSIRVLPSLQDAIDGMSIMKVAWVTILVIVIFVIWLNYLFNENSQASGGV